MRSLTDPIRAPFRRLLLPALAAGALLFAACGDDDEGTSAGDDSSAQDAGAPDSGEDGGTDTGAVQDGPVKIVDFAYEPVDIVASPGQELTFDNADGTPHTATADDDAFNTGSIEGGASGTATAPDSPGEYPFFCSFHPFMKGTVTVQ